MRPAAILFTLLVTVPLSAETTKLTDARATHKTEMARLREKMIADMEALIRSEHERGAGIDFLLKDKKGFVDNDVLPLLPKMQPAARSYLTGKRKADDLLIAALEAALEKATGDEAKRIRDELASMRTPEPKALPKPVPLPSLPTTPASKPVTGVDSQGTFGAFLAGTTWAWPKGGELTFKANGMVYQPGWTAYKIKWEATGRRTVKMTIMEGDRERKGQTATLTMSDDLTTFEGKDFDGSDTKRGTRK